MPKGHTRQLHQMAIKKTKQKTWESLPSGQPRRREASLRHESMLGWELKMKKIEILGAIFVQFLAGTEN